MVECDQEAHPLLCLRGNEKSRGGIPYSTRRDRTQLVLGHVTCALLHVLYCPGYGSAETLSKEANLKATSVFSMLIS